MLRRVTLVRTDVSEEPSASFIRVTRIGELGTTLMVFIRSVRQLLVTANVPSSQILVTLMKEALSSSETSVLTEPHGVTFQKTPFFIDTAMKTSHFTSTETTLAWQNTIHTTACESLHSQASCSWRMLSSGMLHRVPQKPQTLHTLHSYSNQMWTVGNLRA
jgi:hypothetical protein